ncbi:hypothetical protein [Kitasatospora sp. NPDC002965]|uniref:hypothetical protein n=1 Tax=Kitasatospora sp. NPDC002965 TaxID=3154775 RepID=UPI0033A535C3
MTVMTTGRSAGKLAAMAEAAGETGIRELLARWLAAEDPADRGERAGNDDALPGDDGDLAAGGWAVPPATGAEVVEAAWRLAVAGLEDEPRTRAPDGLWMVAEALVVDEHPSASGWTPLERAEAVEWVALLLHRFGEDGVTMLTADLVRGRVDGDGPGPAPRPAGGPAPGTGRSSDRL